MTALYSLTEIRAVELAAQSALPSGTLMQRAGAAAAALALSLLPPSETQHVLILAGPGNNGGDALDVAARLATACEVTVLLFADPAKLPADAAQALQRAQQSDAGFIDTAHAPALLAQSWSLIIDGLFGIGLSRRIEGAIRDAIAALNRNASPVLALDIPSGLDADTGTIVGEDGIAVASLDIDAALFPQYRAELNRSGLFNHKLKPRRQNSHKGSYGDVAVIGGAAGMAGATLLAARAAAKSGAGKTFAVFLGAPPALDTEQPELMCRHAEDFEFGTATLVIGPGLGQSDAAHDVLRRALATSNPLVIDADALNILAITPSLQQALAQRQTPAILTPHPLEAARLQGVGSKLVQQDRLASARTLAQTLRAIVVLKGSGSIIVTPEGMAVINQTGNPGLATAGSGDVLSGVCGALLAQGLSPWEAALAAVWLHGSAADLLVERGIGPIGITAGELIEPIRTLINRIAYRQA